MKAYEITNEEKVPVINNWLGCEGLQCIKPFTHEEKEKCKTAKGLLLILSNKFKLQHNKIVLSLKYQKKKLHRKSINLPQE